MAYEDGDSFLPVPPPGWGGRLGIIEADIRTMQRDVGRLEGQYQTLSSGLGELRTQLVMLGTDIKWIREALLDRVNETEEAVNATRKSSSENSNTAKALGIIGILAAILAGVLHISTQGVSLPLP